MYVAFNGFFLLCDHKGWLAKHKLERKPAQVPSTALIVRTLREAVVGHLVIQPITLYLLFPVCAWLGMVGDAEAPMPPVARIAAQVAASVLINDCLFYWSHRLFHSPLLYSRVH